MKTKGPVIIYRLGGGGAEDFLGGPLDFRRTQKGGSLKTLEGFRGGPLKFAWKMKTWGGDCESRQMLLGRITSVK